MCLRDKLKKILGTLIIRRGIEANSKQITAINDLVSSRTAKEVKKYIGMMAALNQFINNFSDKCLSFFQLLGNNNKFLWNEECELAFQQFKKYLTKSTLLFTLDK